MQFTFDDNIFSDLYKEAYGFRPRGHEYYSAATPERKQTIWDQVLQAQQEEVVRERQAQAAAIESFEARIANKMAEGHSRPDAIQLVIEAGTGEALDPDSMYGDAGMVCYSMGLPYSYEAEIQIVINGLKR